MEAPKIILTDAVPEESPKIVVQARHPHGQSLDLSAHRVAVITQDDRSTAVDVMVTEKGAELPPAMALRGMIMALTRYLFATITNPDGVKSYQEHLEVLIAAEARGRLDQLHDECKSAKTN